MSLTTKPRIAIPVPTSRDTEYNRRSWPMYAQAVEDSGGEAVEVALEGSPATIAELAASCRGILLPGSGADVNPQKYGQEAIPRCAPSDPARENVDELLLQDAHNMGKPILAICFGMQMLNVWRGGSLLQDLMSLPVNHAAGKAVAVAHIAAVIHDSLLGGLVAQEIAEPRGEFLRLPVNSSHHQAIAIPGDGLRVVARSVQDGVIEAVESEDGRFILGIQWHPERSYDISAASRALFGRFVAEAMAWTPRAVTASVAC